MLAGRYCYLQLQDSGIGTLLGYANGERWGRHRWDEASMTRLRDEYGGSIKDLGDDVHKELAWMPWSSLANLTRFIQVGVTSRMSQRTHGVMQRTQMRT